MKTVWYYLAAVALVVIDITAMNYHSKPEVKIVQPAPVVDKSAELKKEKVQMAMWEVAKVFGRDGGCRDANPELGRLVSEASIEQGVDPRIVAAIVSVESKCSQFAVSSKGAIGLMQVTPKTWSSKYDFTGSINLLNSRDNVKIGTKILSESIKQYGLEKGIQAYNGLAIGCATCDEYYSEKVLKLAGL